MTGSPTPSPKLHHALLIGVNLYPKVDGDLQDLKAPRNDVIQWFKLLRRLDVPAADIHVLTSPVLTPEELDSDEVVCELASSDNVNRAVMAYIERARKLGDDAFGFIFLAGHGDYSNGAAYALYLSDYAGPPPRSNDVAANGVLVGWGLHLALSDGREGSRTTLVTDVCRASSVTDNQGDWDSLSPSPRLVILGATGAHRESYERCYDGTWHGQFTWSAMAILRNWPIGRLPHGRTPYLRITAETLRERMATLLSVFNAPGRAQVPTLFQTLADGQDVPTAAGPFLLPGVEAPVAAYAVDAPPHEFSGGTSDFTDSSGTVVGTIFVESVLQPNPNNTQPPPTWTHATWKFKSDPPFSGATQVTFTYLNQNPSQFTGNPALTRTSWENGSGGVNEYPGRVKLVNGKPTINPNFTWFSAYTASSSAFAPGRCVALSCDRDANQTWRFRWYVGQPSVCWTDGGFFGPSVQAANPAPEFSNLLPVTLQAGSAGLTNAPNAGWDWYLWADTLVIQP